MRQYIVVGVAVLLCGCGTKPPGQLELGLARSQAGDFKAAAAHFTEAIREAPDSAQACAARGAAYASLGEFGLAVADHRRAVELAPTDTKLRQAFMNALLDAGHGCEALEQLPACEADLTEEDLLLARARGALQCDDAAAAARDCNSLLAKQPENSAGYFYRALAQARSGDLNAAESNLTRAIELQPRDAKAFWQRYLIRSRLSKPELAEEDRSKAAELDPRVMFSESSVGRNVLQTLKGTSSDDPILEPLKEVP